MSEEYTSSELEKIIINHRENEVKDAERQKAMELLKEYGCV